MLRRARERAALACAAAVLASLTTGCTMTDEPEARPTASAGPTDATERRDPTPGDVDRLEQQIGRLPQVTGVELEYRPKTFENPPAYSGVVSSAATDQKTLDETMDAAYRIVWTAGELSAGAFEFYVENPATGRTSGAASLGMKLPPSYEDLEGRYGPRPA
jgi:hypothetical protein